VSGPRDNRGGGRGPRGARGPDQRGGRFDPRGGSKPGGGTYGPRGDTGGGGPYGRGPFAARDEHRDEHGDTTRGARDLGPIRGPGERVVYGANPVRELIDRKPKSVRAVWVDQQRAGRSGADPVGALVTAARTAGVKVEEREREIIDRSAGEGAVHQGVVAWLGTFEYAQLEDLVQPADEPPLIVALDGVEDPRNLGAILRSAYLLGARGVIIPEHRAAAVTAVTAKASAGASELLPVVQVPNLVRALEELREHGLWRVAVHATETSQRIDEIDGQLGLCLVLGAEGTGVRPLVAKHCDFHAVIPMARTAVGSFNVSVAAAVALYEIRRQRAVATGIPDEA
jgi:23S rRNA (guanosine2251-2'-O)-methyltransferase